ncbi:37S ribosomal protein, mitochondrial [Puccinia graminis f. sp. tritici]|uniref:37S ribosomal protein, mitochondrial n=1 Tax=Puccinia graminis f. sp. tritici TaxID=56615 RepID=A0A5B0R2Z2_PUCGR|nr:37S ribosomal protein, mitochondrial [Puccinia graminis f. sp. tritici]
MAQLNRYQQLLRQLLSTTTPSKPSSIITRRNSSTTTNTTTTTTTAEITGSLSPSLGSSNNQQNDENIKTIRTQSLIHRMENHARKTIEFRQRLAQDRERLSKLGSIQTTLETSKPSHSRTHPTQISDLTLATLITATTHLGHNKALTCPTNFPLIYGVRSDIAIIDARQTLSYLRRACNVIRETVFNDGIVLFSNGVPGTEKAIKQASERLADNGYSLGIRPNGKGASWVRGTLTNATEVLKRPRQVAKQLRLANPSSSSSSSSNEDPQRNKQQQAENLEALKFLPSLIVLFNPRQSRVLLREAALKQIPTIAIIDSDVDPRVVTYPIPANDDSVRSVQLIAGVLSRAGQEGLLKRKQSLLSTFPGSDSLQLS